MVMNRFTARCFSVWDKRGDDVGHQRSGRHRVLHRGDPGAGKDREHPLFRNPYAERCVNDDIRTKVRQAFAALPEGMELVRYRSALFDDIIRQEIDEGMRQIVIPGSGFDMRLRLQYLIASPDMDVPQAGSDTF
jgi:hypothetical protein